MRMALGTWVAIEARGPVTAIEAAFSAIAEVEALLHPDRAGSDLARLREAGLHERTAISPSTYRVLDFARRVFSLSRGVFDPCLPSRPGRLSDLELACLPGESGAWARCRVPLALDCGGIAKGYAVDRAVEALERAGCESGLVNAGGDLRVFGGVPQTILVRRADGRCAALELARGAIAASDRDGDAAPEGHRGYYRRDGRGCAARRFAAVHAPDAMTADALTKCVLLCEPTRAREIVAALGGRILG